MPPPIRSTTVTPPTTTTGSSAGSYTVQSGDTLSKIAQAAGTSVEALVNLNKGRYPSLATNAASISVGWNLQLPTGARPPSTPATPDWKPQTNDKVLFVAINNSYEHMSTFESDALKNRGVNIKVIQDAKTADTIITKDARGVATTHDLNTEQGRMAFALTLGLPAEQTKAIADAISHGGDDIKDEMANIALAWSEAEKGGQAPSRMILSGHHTGSGVYGENNGKLAWPLVKELAEAMPRGARSVQDLMIAGCFSGGEDSMNNYQTMFPNVKTIVAYEGISPGASSGATAHQKIWEQATRGDREGVKFSAFQGTRKGENVSVWTKTTGLDNGQPKRSVDELRSDQARARTDANYDAVLKGDAPVGDVANGPTRQFYIATQRLLQNPQLPASERAELEKLKDQVIRTIFYPVVSKNFQQHHGARVAAGFQALGLPAPDFKTLSRKDALAAIAQFDAKLASTNPAPAAASNVKDLLAGLKDLRTNVIPDTWV
jgi:hypothetical protein